MEQFLTPWKVPGVVPAPWKDLEQFLPHGRTPWKGNPVPKEEPVAEKSALFPITDTELC